MLGAGWLGYPLSVRLRKLGYQVKTATTSAEKAERFNEKGFKAYQIEVTPDGINGRIDDFLQADILVLTLPPGGRRNPEVRTEYPSKIQQVIQAAQQAAVQQVLFTSSTGVYGDQNAWVNEQSPLQPTTPSGEALVKVEDQLRTAFVDQLTVLRLAGLVGGARHPGRWFAGKEGVSGGEQYINLVSRIDVCSICAAIIESGYWGHTLNVCADEHPTKAEFYPTASAALDLATPTFITDPTADRGKRVDNQKSKEVPGFSYEYPDPMRFIL